MTPGADPTLLRLRVQQIQKGALKAGRDPSTIDIWARTLVYVADSKEAARREVASYAATQARDFYYSIIRNRSPEAIMLGEHIEREHPGLIDEIRRVYEAFNHYEHERTDAPHSELVTPRIIDFFNITGTVEDVCERVDRLRSIGITTISTVQYTLVDKKGMLREIGSKIIPQFRR
jgi:alkanesulfonate monooxygenase SsuD/methylene tetrahydromethanopterin reductase-like flavin-dependent oxidoreductase (luciferase family)